MMRTRNRFFSHSLEPAPPGWTDLSVGSSQFSIRLPVLLESRVLQDYGEIEPALGLNTAGLVLSVLSSGLAVSSEDDRLTVALFRRSDGAFTELQLRFRRGFVAGGQEFLLVYLPPPSDQGDHPTGPAS